MRVSTIMYVTVRSQESLDCRSLKTVLTNMSTERSCGYTTCHPGHGHMDIVSQEAGPFVFQNIFNKSRIECASVILILPTVVGTFTGHGQRESQRLKVTHLVSQRTRQPVSK